MRTTLAWLVSYLLGAIPTGWLLVRATARVDLRTVGSGNIGATNALRAAGPWMGLAVLVLDGLKGWLAVGVIAPACLESPDVSARLACGVLAVVGHDFPVGLKFRGGKGVATTLGALLGTLPEVAAGALAGWALVTAACRYVSIGSLVFAVTIPTLQVALGSPPPAVGWGAVLAALIVVRHRSNLQRLRQGTEHRLSFRGRG